MARQSGNYSDALLRLVKALNESRVRYALTGAAAVGYYGIPRSSMDIDVVVQGKLNESQVERLASALARNGFTLNKDEIQRAVAGRELKFQAFDDRTGFLRVDMFLEKSFGRVADQIDGLKVWFRTFEELIAKKIQYGDFEEAKLLFKRRSRRFQKERIRRFLDPKQQAMLERLLKEAKRVDA